MGPSGAMCANGETGDKRMTSYGTSVASYSTNISRPGACLQQDGRAGDRAKYDSEHDEREHEDNSHSELQELLLVCEREDPTSHATARALGCLGFALGRMIHQRLRATAAYHARPVGLGRSTERRPACARAPDSACVIRRKNGASEPARDPPEQRRAAPNTARAACERRPSGTRVSPPSGARTSRPGVARAQPERRSSGVCVVASGA